MSETLPFMAVPPSDHPWEDCNGHRHRHDISEHAWVRLHGHPGATRALPPKIDALLGPLGWHHKPERGRNFLCQTLNEAQQATLHAAFLYQQMPDAEVVDILGQPSFRVSIQESRNVLDPYVYADQGRLFV